MFRDIDPIDRRSKSYTGPLLEKMKKNQAERDAEKAKVILLPVAKQDKPAAAERVQPQRIEPLPYRPPETVKMLPLAVPEETGQGYGGFGSQNRAGGFGGSFGENGPGWMNPDGTLRTGRESPWETLLRGAESGAKLPQSVLELAEREARIDRAARQAGVDTVSGAAPIVAKRDQWKVRADIQRRELERDALGAADFQTARRAGMQEGRPNKNPLLQAMTELGWGVGPDKAHRAVKTLNDPGYARIHAWGNNQYAMENLKYLKPEERAVIEYYAGKGEYGRIEEYLKTIDRALNERQRRHDGPARAEWAKEHPFLGAGANLLYSFTTPAAYLENKRQMWRNAISGEDVPTDVNSDAFFGVHMVRDTERGVSAAAREAAEEATGSPFLGTLAEGGARLGLGAGRFVSKLPLGLEGAAVFAGMERAGETTASVLERGGTPEQAEALAGVTGGVEAALSLLPLDKLFGLAKRNPATAREAAELVAECIGLASGEAVLSQAADQLADTLIMGEQSEYNALVRELEESGHSQSEAQARALLEYWLYQPGQAGFQGALSGGVGALTSLTLGRLFGEKRIPAEEEGWMEAIEAGWADEDGPGVKHKRNIDSDWEDGIIASTGDVFKRTPELERHIQYVDPSTPRKRGIGGAHSSEAFFKNDVQIVKAIPSQDIPGVTHYKYTMPLLGKDGQAMGGYGTTVFKKTVYDPSIFLFEEYMRRGLEAANESYRRNHVLGSYWEGFDSFGVKWVGYGRGGKPTSFFPMFLNNRKEEGTMSDSFLLHEEDMLKEADSPVIGFFSVISDKSDFVRIISHLSNGVGYGYEFAVCLFPDDVYVESEKFGDGVEFSLDNGEAVVLSYEEYYYYLKKACMNYLKKYPEEKNVIDQILEKVRKRHNIME